ncbi:hypothetical protein BD324DRAFT_650751 [Kockovaella imperatae]|uniref:BCD1 alpha/beta domain-containing protein n=1 Tax=Kockovaella imperatae TaxID=4999 RepID=A0A1Y1UGG4_9TREE|nr:hypothetical protein BD324DRAFT_650751 [Kockovaella imperatae]ORX37143.1 hypothetical protein BD324DRAFT_650751 [Kockovaella imperatae]
MGLSRELEQRGIRIEFMPEAMERRKRNQSNWNPKNKILHLTLEFNVDASLTGDGESHSTLKPRVLIEAPSDKSLEQTLPVSLSALLPPDLAARSDLAFAISVPASYIHEDPDSYHGSKLYFPTLDASVPILEALRGIVFLEYPTITIMSRSSWDAQVQDGRVKVLPLLQVSTRFHDNAYKRKRGDEDTTTTSADGKPDIVTQPSTALAELGGYDSDSNEESEVGDRGAVDDED